MKTVSHRLVLMFGMSILSSCAVHRFECTAHGGNEVYQIESQHFVTSGDIEPELLTKEVRRLERMFDAYAEFFKAAPTVPFKMPVFISTGGASSEFFPNTGGFVNYGLEPLMFSTFLQGQDGQIRWSAHAHEMVHLVSHFFLPSQSRWIAEGLAEYLGDAQFKTEEMINFGILSDGSYLGNIDTLEELWAWDDARGEPDVEHQHYRSAWLFIHYLSNKQEAKFTALLNALKTAPSARLAFDSVFSLPERQALHEAVVDYVRVGKYRGWRSTTLRNPDTSKPTKLSSAQIHLLRRKLMRRMQSQKMALAESELAQSASLETRGQEVQVAIAEDTLDGPALTDELQTIQVPELNALLALGWAEDLGLRERLAYFDKAKTLRPTSVLAHYGYATMALRLQEATGFDSAQKAVELAPWNFDARWILSDTAMHIGRCELAKKHIEAALTLSDDRSQYLLQVVKGLRARLSKCVEAP